MSKIRIPRKKKKLWAWANIPQTACNNFPCVPKLVKYYNYFSVEHCIKKFNFTVEQVYRIFGWCTKDCVIWYHWVRKKRLGIEPTMSKEFQEYWDYFVEKGVIK